jgi:hypothetical protein
VDFPHPDAVFDLGLGAVAGSEEVELAACGTCGEQLAAPAVALFPQG